MAFVAERDGESVLWMRALDQGDAQPLAGTEGARYPFWSPDGSALAFFGINGEIKRIEPRGGPAQTVAPSTGPSPADSDPLPELLGRGMIRSSWAIDLMS
jgi:Tol biopolymer transport system component